MLCDGSLAGGAPPWWRPTNNAYAGSEQPSCLDDNGIRRRVQVTYRELCIDWTIQYKAIDGSAPYLKLLCGRCSCKALTRHVRRCPNPTIYMGIFCPYCHATLYDRNEFGQHCVSCWAPHMKPHNISVRATCFRKGAAIRRAPCNVNGCNFVAHIYSV